MAQQAQQRQDLINLSIPVKTKEGKELSINFGSYVFNVSDSILDEFYNTYIPEYKVYCTSIDLDFI